MSYELEFTRTAEEGLAAHARSGNKPLLRKISKLLEEIAEHPYTGTGKPEQLKYEFAGYWSRRINDEHRIVYSVDEGKVTVVIVSTRGHYK